jgi:tetratricopeptide (TPR) repeat protein
MGDCSLKLNNYSEAIAWYEKLIANNHTDSLGIAYVKIASVQIETKKYDAALKNLQTAIQFLPNLLNMQPDIEYEGILGEFYKQIGEAYYKLGSIQKDTERISKYNEAINYLNKSLPLLKDGAGGKENLMEAYELLKQACEEIHDYQKALLYSNLYHHLKDSIYNKTTYLKLADQQVKFKTEKAAAELKVKQEKEKIEQKALSDKMLADQKLEDEIKIADVNLNKERSIAEEKLKSANLIAAEKTKQEKLRAGKQQTNNLLLMGLILVIVTSIFFIIYIRQRHEKNRAIEKAETTHQMAELELQSLRSQLNPHFMFNSLNSIQTLIMKEQTDKSQSYLSRFARLLRMMLENADKPFIPLRMEMEFLQLYLSLESLRVPDMQYSISADPALNTELILIPNMILQPYVENAIWHGLSHKVTDKQLQIRIFRQNGAINYEIEDNGVGRKKAGELKGAFRKQHQSKGIELINKRIELLNKEYSSVIKTEIEDVIKNKEIAGTLVSIKVPLTLSEHSQN